MGVLDDSQQLINFFFQYFKIFVSIPILKKERSKIFEILKKCRIVKFEDQFQKAVKT